MQTERNKGSITVFLAVTFIFIMAMLGTLIDGARLVEAHSQAYYATDLAATSALANFDYKLKDRYGLFGYEGDPGDVIEYVVKQNLNSIQNGELSESEELYQYIYDAVSKVVGSEDASRNKPFDLLQFSDINASQAGTPVTLQNKNEFERQVFEYVKFRGPIELFAGSISFDFDNLDKELEKAENEDKVDEVIRQLEEKLFDHIDAKGQYNQDMKNFRDKMANISSNYYSKILSKLRDTPSISGLSSLKGMMADLSGQLSIESDCDSLIDQISDLEDSCQKIKDEADEIKNEFSGSGDSAMYKGMPISEEMLENYKKDLDDIKEKSELVWKASSDTSEEKQKYNTIKSSAAEIKSRISSFTTQITNLEDKIDQWDRTHTDEDDESGEDHYEDEIKSLWNSLKSHFNGQLYNGGISGVFYNAEILRELAPIIGEQKADESKEWAKKAKEADEKEEDNSRTFKTIPEGYVLPDTIPQADIDDKQTMEFDTDFRNGMSRGDITTKRDANRSKTKGIKDLFGGVGDLTLDTFDNAMLGLYAIGNFENALCYADGKPRPSGYSHSEIDVTKHTLNMRNDPIENFFEDCELEYLIKGNKDEKKNYQGIRNELTGVYFALNYAGVRKAPQINAVVKSMAYAVEAAVTLGTLGLGAAAGRVAFYATREACYAALAGIQTSHDLERLYLGNKVPLLKKTDQDFCGVGFVSGASCTEGGTLAIGYVDYLFVRMIITGHDKLLGRLQNLVELNMNGGNSSSFKLKEMNTSASVKMEATMPFFFINVMFMAENFDGKGIKVTKYASQKY